MSRHAHTLPTMDAPYAPVPAMAHTNTRDALPVLVPAKRTLAGDIDALLDGKIGEALATIGVVVPSLAIGWGLAKIVGM